MQSKFQAIMSNKINEGKININKAAILNEIDALKSADHDILCKQQAIVDK